MNLKNFIQLTFVYNSHQFQTGTAMRILYFPAQSVITHAPNYPFHSSSTHTWHRGRGGHQIREL